MRACRASLSRPGAGSNADASPLSLAAGHREAEADLKPSGLRFTILRDGWCTENYTGSAPGAAAGGALLGSAGGGKISSAPRADYAAAAAAALTGAGHEGKTYELAGDGASTLPELAAERSPAGPGRPSPTRTCRRPATPPPWRAPGCRAV